MAAGAVCLLQLLWEVLNTLLDGNEGAVAGLKASGSKLEGWCVQHTVH